MWIEIFKAGRHTDSSGKTSSYTEKQLDEIAELYNAKTSESPAYEAPVVKGHPKTNDPAYGWVEKLKRNGNVLLAKLKDVASEFIDEVKNGRFRRVSVALFPDMMLRHIGFLGAATPAVKGLKPVNFDEADFSEYLYDGSEIDIDIEKNNELLRNELEVLKQKINEYQQEAKYWEFEQFIEDLNKTHGGRYLTPSQTYNAINLLRDAYTIDLVTKNRTDENTEFSMEEELSPRLMQFIADLYHYVPSGEFACKSDAAIARENKDFFGRNVSMERLETHKKATALLSRSPWLSYEEAVIQVLGQD